MDRREALKRAGLLLGVAVSPSVVSAVLSGCRHGARTTEKGGSRPQTLTPEQDALTTALAEIIIPTTDTPGARDAGVNEFIDIVMTKFYTPAERDGFLAGLADVEQRARRRGAKSFVACAPEVQTAIVTELEAEAKKAWESGAAEKQKPFFSSLKELTVFGYYTSEVGATIELKYVEMAKTYEGDIPFAKVGRTYSL